MAKKSDGRVDAPESAAGAASLASDALLNAWASDELDLTKLTREQQLLFAVATLRQGVSSDGFAGYFSSSSSVLEPVTTEAARILGDAWAELFLEAQAVADGLDRDAAALRDSGELKALDRRFAELEASTASDTQLDAWVGWNRDKIFRTKRFGII